MRTLMPVGNSSVKTEVENGWWVEWVAGAGTVTVTVKILGEVATHSEGEAVTWDGGIKVLVECETGEATEVVWIVEGLCTLVAEVWDSGAGDVIADRVGKM